MNVVKAGRTNLVCVCVFPPQTHKACRELIQCTALTRIIYGNGHWRLAQALANLAHSYLTLQGLPVQAMHHANSARYTISTGKGTPSASSEERGEILSTLVTIYYTLGVANLMQKNGKESYYNLQKAERIMEELKGTNRRGTPELKVSKRDLLVTLGRASSQQNKLDLAVGHFEKAIDAIISAEGKMAPELINLYQEIAQIKQVKGNHKKSIEYLLQAHSISLALHKKFSAEAASTALLLGKAYTATGEEKHVEAAEMYFSESLEAYKVALGINHSQTISALEDFSKWLGRVGKRKQAYDLLKESFKSQQDPCSDFNEQAVERLYIMGCICLVEKKIREAFQLLSKCAQIQVAIYGSHHRKSKKIQELLDMLKM
ncbi:tetratricopeptide repeat protein 23-like [Rhineura floridana]|uniref:tetratricopeptide repeat protein 23-like n=1 Tax=Rhineura floridana TaxID=261503 RepID=UPI002AC87E90|nr:tetratricopeptide repeat protein 23-like [Rhineura floridana]